MGRFRVKLLYVALLLIMAVLLPCVVTDYWKYIFMLAFYYVVMAASWNLLAGYTGQFSLAHHTFALMAGYTSGLMTTKIGIPLWMGIPAGISLAIIGSLLLGFLCLRLRGIYLALITWSFAEVVRTYIRMDYGFTGGDRGYKVPLIFATREPGPYYYLFLGLSVFTIALIAVIMRSRIGYYLKSIRNDELAAQAMGVNIVSWKIFAFVMASGLAGMAGVFYAHSVGLISPVLGGFNEISMIIVSVVIGGMRTQAGPILGAISVRYLMEFLGEWAEMRMILLSAIVIIIMRFFNGGLLELFKQTGRWARHRVVKGPKSSQVQRDN